MANATAEPPVASREPYHIKLYNLPRDSNVKIYGLEPNGDKDGVVIFGHLDGMYSFCWVMDPEAPNDQTDKVVHLKATLPLVEYADGYMVEEEPKDDKDVASA